MRSMDFTDCLRSISLAKGEFHCNAKRCLALPALTNKVHAPQAHITSRSDISLAAGEYHVAQATYHSPQANITSRSDISLAAGEYHVAQATYHSPQANITSRKRHITSAGHISPFGECCTATHRVALPPKNALPI